LRKIFLFIWLFSAAFALHHDPYELAAFGGEPSSIIGGCVSAISGDYFFLEDVLVVKGYEPIHLQQSYISREGKSVYSGWNLGESHLVAIMHIVKSPMGNNYFLQITERSGVRLVYTDNQLAKENQNHFILISTPGGLTNCSKRDISARLNLRNNVVYRDMNDLKQIIVKGADGGVRCYRAKKSLKFDKPVKGLKVESEDVLFLLSSELLPNGNRIKYTYDQIHEKWFPKTITTMSHDEKEVFSWVKFDYDYPDKNHLKWIQITTSDHQVLCYDFDPHAKNGKMRHWLLKRIIHPVKPDESYEYNVGEKGGFYLSKRILPNERRLRINYYGKNKTVLPLGEVNVKDEHDPKYNTVSSLEVPIGNNENLYYAYQIFYHPGEYQKSGGYTDAYDALGNLTKYNYDKNLMLTSQKRFIGKEKLFSEDLFYPCQTKTKLKTLGFSKRERKHLLKRSANSVD
jgi:hypothetical protein